MCDDFISPNLPAVCDDYVIYDCIDIIGDKMYKNGLYWGDVVSTVDNLINVKCNNGNKYMDGQIIKVYIYEDNM